MTFLSDDTPRMADVDLTNLTEEERSIIEAVREREREDAMKNYAVLRRRESLTSQQRKVFNLVPPWESFSRHYVNIDDGNLCVICRVTKFVSKNAGYICTFCQTTFCSRCGFEFKLDDEGGEVMWICSLCEEKKALFDRFCNNVNNGFNYTQQKFNEKRKEPLSEEASKTNEQTNLVVSSDVDRNNSSKRSLKRQKAVALQPNSEDTTDHDGCHAYPVRESTSGVGGSGGEQQQTVYSSEDELCALNRGRTAPKAHRHSDSKLAKHEKTSLSHAQVHSLEEHTVNKPTVTDSGIDTASSQTIQGVEKKIKPITWKLNNYGTKISTLVSVNVNQPADFIKNSESSDFFSLFGMELNKSESDERPVIEIKRIKLGKLIDFTQILRAEKASSSHRKLPEQHHVKIVGKINLRISHEEATSSLCVFVAYAKELKIANDHKHKYLICRLLLTPDPTGYFYRAHTKPSSPHANDPCTCSWNQKLVFRPLTIGDLLDYSLLVSVFEFDKRYILIGETCIDLTKINLQNESRWFDLSEGQDHHARTFTLNAENPSVSTRLLPSDVCEQRRTELDRCKMHVSRKKRQLPQIPVASGIGQQQQETQIQNNVKTGTKEMEKDLMGGSENYKKESLDVSERRRSPRRCSKLPLIRDKPGTFRTRSMEYDSDISEYSNQLLSSQEGTESDSALIDNFAAFSTEHTRSKQSVAKALVILGLTKRSRTKRHGFHRSEEIGVDPELSSEYIHQKSSTDDLPRLWSGTLKLPHEKNFITFVEDLGPGQLVGRQVLGSPVLGELQLNLRDRNAQLEIEVIKGRNLIPRHVGKVLPAPCVKLYLLDGKNCVEKQQIKFTKRTLEPVYEQTILFHESYFDRSLQVSLCGDYGKLGRKVFMGICQIDLSELHLQEGETILGWYKLFSSASVLLAGTSRRRLPYYHYSSLSSDECHSAPSQSR